MKGKKKITDRETFEVLFALSEELERCEIPYAVIGGFSVQLYLANWYNKRGTQPLNKCPILKDMIRATGDVDLVARPGEMAMIAFFNHFAQSYPRFAVYNAPSYALIQGLSINYIYEPRELKGPAFVYDFISEESLIMNLFPGSSKNQVGQRGKQS